jgi:hypothetical protein
VNSVEFRSDSIESDVQGWLASRLKFIQIDTDSSEVTALNIKENEQAEDSLVTAL